MSRLIHFEMKRAKLSGSITIFLSLSLLFIFSLFILLIESVRIEVFKTRANGISYSAMESSLSCYAKELFEQYGIFSMYASEDNFINITKKYIDINSQKLSLPIYLKLQDIKINEPYYLTDNYGYVFASQIVRYQKYHGISDVIKKINSDKKIYSDTKKDASSYLVTDGLSIDEETLKSLNTTTNADISNESTDIDPKNISDNVSSILKSNLLHLLIPKNIKISNYSVDDTNYNAFPSVISSKSEYKVTVSSTTLSLSIPDSCLYFSYLISNFSSFKTEINKAIPLKYQLEYIISGKASDSENLLTCATQILAMRSGLNILHIMSDGKKLSEARNAGLSAAALIPLPFANEICQFMIINSWAISEAIIDVRDLLNDKKVPLIKTNENWTLSINALPTFTVDTISQNKGNKGLSYDEYLYALLIKDDPIPFYYKTMDLIQLHMREAYNPDFNMSGCIGGANMNFTFYSSPIFKIPNYTLPKSYKYSFNLINGYD